MFDSIFNLCDVSKIGGEKIWKIMPLIIARQMYRFGNWLRISVILKMLYNQLVDIWTTHSRHLNREIIDIVAQRRKLIGSWQSLKSENIRVGRDPGGQWIQQEFPWESLHTSMPLPLLGSCPISPTSVLSPLGHGCSGYSDGWCFISGGGRDVWRWKRQTKTHSAGTSFWYAFMKRTPSLYICEKHLGSQWYREWNGYTIKPWGMPWSCGVQASPVLKSGTFLWGGIK